MTPETSLLAIATDPSQYERHGIDFRADTIDSTSERNRTYWAQIEPIVSTWAGRRVLDIGSGVGWMLPLLKGAGAAGVEGLEPSEGHRAISEQTFPDFKVHARKFEEFSPEETYDGVLAVMVLCHIADVQAFFQKVRGLLNEDGEFVAIIPTFFEDPELRSSRNGKKYQVEVIDEDQYIDMRTDTTTYAIADIARRISYYERAARENGLELVNHIPFEDRKGYTPKHLLHFRKI